MDSSQNEITDAVTPGMPRRAAMQGLAGSLAGLAALGAAGASAKKKNKKKSTAGTLVRVELAEETKTVPPLSTDTITATCPAASSIETLFVLGGGFDVNNPNGNVADFFVRESRATSNIAAWKVEASNTSATQSGDVTAQAVCAYFRT